MSHTFNNRLPGVELGKERARAGYASHATYWNAYWMETYTVLDQTSSGPGWSVTVQWHGDGKHAFPSEPRVTSHMTALEARDRLVHLEEVRCEFTWNPGVWPYVQRCDSDTTHMAFVRTPSVNTHAVDVMHVCTVHAAFLQQREGTHNYSVYSVYPELTEDQLIF